MTVRRRVLLGIVVVAAVVAVWLAISAFMTLRATRELADAASHARDVQAAALSGDSTQAQAALALASSSSRAAQSNLDSPVLAPITWFPIIGTTLKAARTLADASTELSTQAMTKLVAAAVLLDPKTLRTGPTSINLDRLVKAVPLVSAGAADLERVSRKVAAIDASSLLPQVRQRFIDARQTLTSGTSTLSRTSTALTHLPSLLGGNGVRRYFVAFLSPAEARGTGGLIGQYAVIKADKGAITIERLGSDADLGMMADSPLVMGDNYDGIYGQDMRYWVNMNQSPDMRPAARMWLKAWQIQFHQKLDGVFSLDPIAVGHVIDAVGATITLPDHKVFTTGQQFADYALNGIYIQYGDAGNSTTRKVEQIAIARAVLQRLLSASSDPRAFMRGLGQGVRERRVLLYSIHPQDEALFTSLGATGVLDTKPGGYAFAVVNNGAGDKIDYYLQRSLNYHLSGCSKGKQRATISFSMLNAVPTDIPLPFYVAGNLNATKQTPARSGYLLVRIYLPEGTTITHAASGGVTDSNEVDNEAGRPFYWTTATTKAGKPYVVNLDVTYPATSAKTRIIVQPLSMDQKTLTSGNACHA